jgi:hypothetical protein
LGVALRADLGLGDGDNEVRGVVVVRSDMGSLMDVAEDIGDGGELCALTVASNAESLSLPAVKTG